MKAVTALILRLDDLMNPIVVKELRQAVHSRFVTSMIILVLLVLLVVIGAVLLASGEDSGTQFTLGRNTFLTLHGLLFWICTIFGAAYAGLRMAAERSDVNVDLLFVTTIKPRAIIWGKLFAGMVMALLVYSVSMPFVTMTYLLRGIDIPTIFVLLGLDMLLILLAVQSAIFVAVLNVNVIFKILVALIYLGGLLFMLAGATGASIELVNFGVGAGLDTWDFWGPALGITLGVMMIVGMLLVLSISLLTPISANRSLPVRLYLTAAWLVGAVCYRQLRSVSADLPMAWFIICLAALCMMLLVTVSERDDWGLRMRTLIPKPLPLRVLAMLFFSGAAGGITWCVIMIGLTVLLCHPAPSTGIAALLRADETAANMVVVVLYVYCYCMTAAFLRWTILKRWMKPGATGATAFIIAAAGTLVPPLVIFFSGTRWGLGGGALLGNPFGLFIAMADPPAVYNAFWRKSIIFVSIWALGITLANIPWFVRQFQRFKPAAIVSRPN